MYIIYDESFSEEVLLWKLITILGEGILNWGRVSVGVEGFVIRGEAGCVLRVGDREAKFINKSFTCSSLWCKDLSSFSISFFSWTLFVWETYWLSNNEWRYWFGRNFWCFFSIQWMNWIQAYLNEERVCFASSIILSWTVKRSFDEAKSVEVDNLRSSICIHKGILVVWYMKKRIWFLISTRYLLFAITKILL